MSQAPSRPDVVVVGAGVIGLSIALEAQRRGLTVTIVDRDGPAAGASAGNAGAFAFTDILPLASPGMVRKVPRWLLDPLGPLSVPPAYALRIAPWMWRFLRACAPDRFRRAAAAQASLMDLSRAELEPFLARSKTLDMLRRDGNLEVYEGAAERDAARPAWRAREAHGIAFRHLDADEMAALQPGLSPRLTHGTFTPGWLSIAEPRDYVLRLADRFREAGGAIERAEVSSLRAAGEGVEWVAGGAARRAGRIVLAAGAFSHRLTTTLGEPIPLETERGYNTTLPPSAFDLRTQITFGGHGFVVTRLSSGIRVGGAVELGGLSRPPDFRRADAMLAKAKVLLPGLETAGGSRWMGFRPSLPDSLPALGRSKKSDRVLYAFGHGHLGLTQSAGTARIVADMLVGTAPPIDLAPFSPQRF